MENEFISYDDVSKSFQRFSSILEGFEASSAEWSKELTAELESFSKVNLLSALGSNETAELTGVLNTLHGDVHPLDLQAIPFDRKLLDEDFAETSSLIELAKEKSNDRVTKLTLGFKDLKRLLFVLQRN
jgi:hypothetical protein